MSSWSKAWVLAVRQKGSFSTCAVPHQMEDGVRLTCGSHRRRSSGLPMICSSPRRGHSGFPSRRSESFSNPSTPSPRSSRLCLRLERWGLPLPLFTNCREGLFSETYRHKRAGAVLTAPAMAPLLLYGPVRTRRDEQPFLSLDLDLGSLGQPLLGANLVSNHHITAWRHPAQFAPLRQAQPPPSTPP